MGKISTAGSLEKKRKRASTRTKKNKSLASRKVNVARQSNETNWNFLNHPEKSNRKLQPSTVNGAIIYDVSRKPWRLGDQIGKGSFGQIFLASNNITEPVSNANAKYVVKVEPHSNGTLFVEIHCLLNIARNCGKNDKSSVWKQKQSNVTNTSSQAPFSGIPEYIASGSHYFNYVRYRFLILQRFDSDLYSLIKNCRVHQKTLLTLAVKILNALEVLHDKGYCHNDLKAQNVMLFKQTAAEPVTAGEKTCSAESKIGVRKRGGLKSLHSFGPRKRARSSPKPVKKDTLGVVEDNDDDSGSGRFKSYIAETLSAIAESQIVLIDFGLSTKYMSNGAHRPFIMDERRGHDGTIKFTSRDAHMGAHSRRSDLECLGYNLIYWSQGYLPWEDAAKNRQLEKVQHAKELLMTDVRKMIKQIYGNQVPKFLGEFLHQVNQLAFSERPDYAGCRKIFEVEFQKMGYSIPNMRLYPHEILRTNEHISEKNRQNGKRLDIMKKVSEAVLPRLRSRSPKKSVTTKTFSNVEILGNPDDIAQERVARELAREKELNDIQQPIIRRYDGQPTYAILELQQRTESKRQLYHKARKEYQEGLNKAGDKRLSGGRKRVVKAPGIRARNGWKSINKSKRVSHTRLNLNRNYGMRASNIQLLTGNALQDTNDSGDSFGTIEE